MARQKAWKRPRHVGLITKLQDPEAVKSLVQLLPLFREIHKRHRVQFSIEAAAAQLLKSMRRPSEKFFQLAPIDQMANHCDLMIVVGGDGTILRSTRYLLHRDGWKSCSLLGVNAGYLGFLTFLSSSNAWTDMEAVLSAKKGVQIERRSCLQVAIERKSKFGKIHHVLNECTLGKGSISRIFEFHVEINSKFLSSYRADGFIVSTPTGSTAYNLAAGGSILEATIPAIQLTPICPQSFSNKPIVVSDRKIVTLSLGRHSSDVFLTLDGHTALRVESGDRIHIKKSPKSVDFLLPPGMDSSHYFDSLRQKLKWGLVSA